MADVKIFTRINKSKRLTPSFPPTPEDGVIPPVINPDTPSVIQIPPVEKRYDSEALMIDDQNNQRSGYLYFDGTNTWWYKGNGTGVIGDYEEFGGGSGSSNWTVSGSDIYRNSKVTIGQSSIIDANLGVFQSAPTSSTPAIRINSVDVTSTRRDVISVYTGSTKRFWLDTYGIPAWKLYNGASEAGALSYTTPIGGLFGILTGTDETFPLSTRAGITWNPNATGGLIACNIFTLNTSRLAISAVGTMAFGGATLSASESYRFRNISGASIIAQFVNSAFSANSLICYEDLRVFVDRIQTNNFTGTTARIWKLGERKAAPTALDTTQYLTVEVNGVTYNLALATI